MSSAAMVMENPSSDSPYSVAYSPMGQDERHHSYDHTENPTDIRPLPLLPFLGAAYTTLGQDGRRHGYDHTQNHPHDIRPLPLLPFSGAAYNPVGQDRRRHGYDHTENHPNTIRPLPRLPFLGAAYSAVCPDERRHGYDHTPNHPNDIRPLPLHPFLDAACSPMDQDEKPHGYDHTENHTDDIRPLALHPFLGWGLVGLFLSLGITLAVITAYSETHDGLFTIPPIRNARQNVLRFMWSSGPTLVMTLIVTVILAPMALEMFIITPYAALDRTAAAEEGLLVNYVPRSMHGRFLLAKRTHQWGLLSLVVVTFLAQWTDTAASGLIDSRNLITTSNIHLQITTPLGISPSKDANQADGSLGDGTDGEGNHIFLSSDLYLGAILFSGSQQYFNPSPVPFTYRDYNPYSEDNWSITPFNLRNETLQGLELGSNSTATGTVSLVTNGVKANANCKMADNTSAGITFQPNQTVTATVNGCSFTWSLQFEENTNGRWHWANTTQCTAASKVDKAFRTFVYGSYAFSGYNASDPNLFVIMFCQPTISIAKVYATLLVDHLGAVGGLVSPPEVLESYPIGSNPSDPTVAGLLGPPLNGNALNGYDIAEPLTAANLSRAARANLTDNILFEGIYGSLIDEMGPFDETQPSTWFNETQRAKMGSIIAVYYQAYLSAFAPSAYFNANTTAVVATGQLSTPVTRALISGFHAIALGVLLLLLSILLSHTLYTQRHLRCLGPRHHVYRLRWSTILTHVMASSPVLDKVIRGCERETESDIRKRLGSMRFRLDANGRIYVMDLEGNQLENVLSAEVEMPVLTGS